MTVNRYDNWREVISFVLIVSRFQRSTMLMARLLGKSLVPIRKHLPLRAGHATNLLSLQVSVVLRGVVMGREQWEAGNPSSSDHKLHDKN